MTDRICAVVGCPAQAKAKGLCGSHYMKQRRYGSPTAIPKSRDFMAIVAATAKPDPSSGCIEWPNLNPKGYGVTAIGRKAGRSTLVHRRVYEYLRNNDQPLPADVFVCHSCDNPCCCNGDHLYAGDNRANLIDASDHGLMSHGTWHDRAKLTEDDIDYMRASTRSDTDMADLMGISPGRVRDIRDRYSWKNTG